MPRFYGGYRRSFRRRSYGSRYGRSYRSRRFSAVRRVARTTALKAVRNMSPLKMQSSTDGAFSVSTTVAQTASTVAGYPLAILPGATDPDHLDTDKCRFSGFKIKYHLVTGDEVNFIRLMVVDWVNVTTASLTMLPQTVLHTPDTADRANYTMLSDKVVSLSKKSIGTGTTNTEKIVEIYIPYKRNLDYNLTGGPAPVEPTLGANGKQPRIVRLYAVSDSAVISHPTVECHITRYFHSDPTGATYTV